MVRQSRKAKRAYVSEGTPLDANDEGAPNIRVKWLSFHKHSPRFAPDVAINFAGPAVTAYEGLDDKVEVAVSIELAVKYVPV